MQGKGEEDICGWHAIANALSLALGIDPTEISYDKRAIGNICSTASRKSVRQCSRTAPDHHAQKVG